MNAIRQSSWIITLSLAAIAVAYLMLVWSPNHQAIKKMSDQVETKRAFVAQATGFSKAIIGIQEELDKTQVVVAQWEKTAPGKRDISALYGKINAVAENAHLAITRFDPQPFVLHEKLYEIPITMNCTGTFSQIYEFLRSVERLSATIWVESIRLEKMAQNAKDVQCELNLVVFSDKS